MPAADAPGARLRGGRGAGLISNRRLGIGDLVLREDLGEFGRDDLGAADFACC